MKDLARQWENHTLTSEAKENTIFPLAENGGEMEVGIVENEGKSLYVQYSNININRNIHALSADPTSGMRKRGLRELLLRPQLILDTDGQWTTVAALAALAKRQI